MRNSENAYGSELVGAPNPIQCELIIQDNRLEICVIDDERFV